MLLRAINVLSVVVFGLCVAEKLNLPAGVRTCKHDSADYNICLKRAIKNAWPLLAAGLPEYQFPSFDPLLYGTDKGTFDRNELYGEVMVKNLTCEGFAKTRIMAARTHLENDTFHLEFDMRTSELFIQGGCEAQGTLGGFRMGGKGYFNMTLEDVRDTWIASGFVKDDTWNIEHFRISPVFKKLKMHLDNVFEGSREMNELGEMFVNEYWPPLYRIVLPVIIEHFDKYASNSLNHLFSKLSFSELFP